MDGWPSRQDSKYGAEYVPLLLVLFYLEKRGRERRSNWMTEELPSHWYYFFLRLLFSEKNFFILGGGSPPNPPLFGWRVAGGWLVMRL